jgi:hypothetical protein
MGGERPILDTAYYVHDQNGGFWPTEIEALLDLLSVSIVRCERSASLEPDVWVQTWGG